MRNIYILESWHRILEVRWLVDSDELPDTLSESSQPYFWSLLHPLKAPRQLITDKSFTLEAESGKY